MLKVHHNSHYLHFKKVMSKFAAHLKFTYMVTYDFIYYTTKCSGILDEHIVRKSFKTFKSACTFMRRLEQKSNVDMNVEMIPVV